MNLDRSTNSFSPTILGEGTAPGHRLHSRLAERLNALESDCSTAIRIICFRFEISGFQFALRMKESNFVSAIIAICTRLSQPEEQNYVWNGEENIASLPSFPHNFQSTTFPPEVKKFIQCGVKQTISQ
jgi:hypothetical protein